MASWWQDLIDKIKDVVSPPQPERPPTGRDEQHGQPLQPDPNDPSGHNQPQNPLPPPPPNAGHPYRREGDPSDAGAGDLLPGGVGREPNTGEGMTDATKGGVAVAGAGAAAGVAIVAGGALIVGAVESGTVVEGAVGAGGAAEAGVAGRVGAGAAAAGAMPTPPGEGVQAPQEPSAAPPPPDSSSDSGGGIPTPSPPADGTFDPGMDGGLGANVVGAGESLSVVIGGPAAGTEDLAPGVPPSDDVAPEATGAATDASTVDSPNQEALASADGGGELGSELGEDAAGSADSSGDYDFLGES